MKYSRDDIEFDIREWKWEFNKLTFYKCNSVKKIERVLFIHDFPQILEQLPLKVRKGLLWCLEMTNILLTVENAVLIELQKEVED